MANVTDPDSVVMKGKGMSPVQGYNAQAAVTEHQIVVAAELSTSPTDAPNFGPMVKKATDALHRAGVGQPVRTVVADAG